MAEKIDLEILIMKVEIYKNYANILYKKCEKREKAETKQKKDSNIPNYNYEYYKEAKTMIEKALTIYEQFIEKN